MWGLKELDIYTGLSNDRVGIEVALWEMWDVYTIG